MDAAIDNYLKTVLDRLGRQYQEMERSIEPPVPRQINTPRGSGVIFRHTQQSDTLLCFLKGIKLVSTLNAVLLLAREGYGQECGALSRIANDCYMDILFLLKPRNGTEPSRDQERFFEECFQEEFDDPSLPFGGNQKRDMVGRKSVFAAYGSLVEGQLNPSDAQTAMTTIHKALSGYIHGAYPHIMELYGGTPPHFHMSGMPNTVRQAEAWKQLVDETYRAIMVTELVARKLGLDQVRQATRDLLVEYETELGVKPTVPPEDLLRKTKKKT